MDIVARTHNIKIKRIFFKKGFVRLTNSCGFYLHFPSQRSLQERRMSVAGTPRTMKLKRE